VELLVCYDEREERYGFTCARGHFQDAVAASVQRAFEIAHVGILLWIYPRVGEKNR
jgi:hypothetical protein